MFLKISQENTSARVSFLIKLQAWGTPLWLLLSYVYSYIKKESKYRTLPALHILVCGINNTANNYLFKFNKRDTRKTCEIGSNLTRKISEGRQWCCSGVFLVKLELISQLWTGKCLLGKEYMSSCVYIREFSTQTRN